MRCSTSALTASAPLHRVSGAGQQDRAAGGPHASRCRPGDPPPPRGPRATSAGPPARPILPHPHLRSKEKQLHQCQHDRSDGRRHSRRAHARRLAAGGVHGHHAATRGSPSPLGQNSPHLCQAGCASHVLHSPFTFSILLIAGRSSQPTSSHRGDRVPVCFKIGWRGGGASGTRRQGAIGCTVPGMLLDDIAPQEAIGVYAESTHVGQQRVLQGPPAPNTPRLPAATEACHRSCIAHFRHGDRSMEEQTSERHRHLRPDDLHTPAAQTSTPPAVQ